MAYDKSEPDREVASVSDHVAGIRLHGRPARMWLHTLSRATATTKVMAATGRMRRPKQRAAARATTVPAAPSHDNEGERAGSGTDDGMRRTATAIQSIGTSSTNEQYVDEPVTSTRVVSAQPATASASQAGGGDEKDQLTSQHSGNGDVREEHEFDVADADESSPRNELRASGS
ncbi:unnamed protein product [Phytophthora fragariaefolia]|uniref:Unnamed protein product n=1 Tax=Phytophthora fragariaefolia TaxID=1490495 RepID=A0A9W6XRL4_9STRA|nr:unnamed protein product [Phytophthora fragariaefolia]